MTVNGSEAVPEVRLEDKNGAALRHVGTVRGCGRSLWRVIPIHPITAMSTYVTFLNFTQQGLQNIHESPHRAAAFKAAARRAGCKILHLLWTLGAHDGVIVFQAKDDTAATGLMMALSALGNVHTSTMRAFDAAEFAGLVNKAPKM